MNEQRFEQKLEKVISKAVSSTERRKLLKDAVMRIFKEYLKKPE